MEVQSSSPTPEAYNQRQVKHVTDTKHLPYFLTHGLGSMLNREQNHFFGCNLLLGALALYCSAPISQLPVLGKGRPSKSAS